MRQVISFNGVSVVTTDENNSVINVQFLPDDEFTPVLEKSSKGSGQLQLMRNGTFDFVPSKPRQRAKSTLLRKAAHGRLSATRDEAYQLTLKLYKREGLEVKETMLREAVELISNVKF